MAVKKNKKLVKNNRTNTSGTKKKSNTRQGTKHDSGKPPVTQFLRQFPDAIKYVSGVSEYGHNLYGKKEDNDAWDNWRHVPNARFRYEQALGRHLLFPTKAMDDESNFYHVAHAAWNSLAVLQLYLEEIGYVSSKYY